MVEDPIYSPEYYSIIFIHKILLTKDSIEQQLTEEEKATKNAKLRNLSKKGIVSAKLKLIEKMKAILGIKEVTEEQFSLLFDVVEKQNLMPIQKFMNVLTAEEIQELDINGFTLYTKRIREDENE